MGGFVDVGLAVWRPGTGALEPMGQKVKALGKEPGPKEAERIQSQEIPGLGGRIRHCFCTVSGKPRGARQQAAVRARNEGLILF